MLFFLLGIDLLLLLLVLLVLLGIVHAWSCWSRVRRQVFGVNRSWRTIRCSGLLSGYDKSPRGEGLISHISTG